MSSHVGVSCDGCLKTNFADRRYKCLICENFDLCGSCYDSNRETRNHLKQHPMQCILTKTAHEIFYGGETIPHRSVVSLSCPFCGESGFVPRSLLKHFDEQHSTISNETLTKQLVICPICVLMATQDFQTRFVSLSEHFLRDHDCAEMNVQLRTLENKRELVDPDDDEDEDEAVPLNFLAERIFLKEETRRNHFNLQSSAHRASYRRVLSRHTAIRSSRGLSRGHFNHSPYTIVGRPSNTSTTMSFQQTNESNSLNQNFAEQFFSQTATFNNEFDSTFARIFPNDAFFLTATISNYIPSFQTNSFPQQNENNERTNQKKTNFSNGKQKRTCLHPSQTSFQSLPVAPSTNIEINPTTNSVRNDERPEKDFRSLLGKILKCSSMTENESSSTDKFNHFSFVKSLLFSSIFLNFEEKNEKLC